MYILINSPFLLYTYIYIYVFLKIVNFISFTKYQIFLYIYIYILVILNLFFNTIFFFQKNYQNISLNIKINIFFSKGKERRDHLFPPLYFSYYCKFYYNKKFTTRTNVMYLPHTIAQLLCYTNNFKYLKSIQQ